MRMTKMKADVQGAINQYKREIGFFRRLLQTPHPALTVVESILESAGPDLSPAEEFALAKCFIKSSLKTLSVSSGMKYALNRVVMRHDEIEETKPLRIPMRVSSGTCNEVPS